MKQRVTIAVVSLLLSAARILGASSLSEDELLKIRFDQRLEAQVPLNLQFRDERGADIALRSLFRGKPVILVLGYYECPMLCSLVLNGLVKGLHDLKLKPGDDFDVIMISIDPRETPELAAAKERTYLKRYGRTHNPSGWHFLTGAEPAIRWITTETGYHYAYDAGLAQYAHPSGLIILTPQGKISHYLFGVEYSGSDLNTALREAGAGGIGSPIRQFILLCFHYQPLTGKYGNLIMGVVRAGGILTILAVAAMIVSLKRRRHLPAAPGSAIRSDSTPETMEDGT